MIQISAIDTKERIGRVLAEVNRIAECAAKGADEYSILGVSPDAGLSEIIKAYNSIAELLHPVKCRDSLETAVSPEDLNRAFLNVVNAFSGLANSVCGQHKDERPQVDLRDLNDPRVGLPRARDRRRTSRFELPLPVRVSPDNFRWREVSKSHDISSFGIRFTLKQPVVPGEILSLEMPMPPGLRLYNSGEGLYLVTAVVRYSCDLQGGDRLIGAEFLGGTRPPNQETTGETEPQESRIVPRRRRILIADDDGFMREMLRVTLARAGYDVIMAEDGRSAVEKAACEKPDLVVTDALMPKMHGFLVCKAIKELEAPPRVLILTAVYTKPNYKWTVKRDYGADELLMKPIKPFDLLRLVQKYLSDERHVGTSDLPKQLIDPSSDSSDEAGNAFSVLA